MKYRIIELEKDYGLKVYRVDIKWLCFWVNLRGSPRGKDGSLPGPILWFGSIKKADRWVRKNLLKSPKNFRSRVVRETTTY